MPSRDAWLAIFAAALGVSEEACKREAKDAPQAVHDVPSASTSSAIVAATAPSASAEPAASVSAAPSAAPSASAVASASASPKKQAEDLAKLLEQNTTMLQSMQAACGAVAQQLTIGSGTGPGIGRIGNGSCGATSSRNTTPTANVTVNATNGIAGDEPVLARLRPRIRNCANRALQQNPDEQGKLLVTVAIGPDGRVTAATISNNAGLSQNSAQCMMSGLRAGTFPTSPAARTLLVAITQTRTNP